MTTNYRITGNTQAPPLYPLNSTTIPTVNNVTIASNLATATAAAGSFVTWDYEASNTVTKITPKFTMQLSGLTIDPTSTTGSIKINYPNNNTLQVGSKILVTDGGVTTEQTIAGGSQATITNNWTQRTLPANANWHSIAYGNNIYVAVANSTDVYATSPDGIIWTQRTLPLFAQWQSITFGNGLFVAVAFTSNQFITSTDGINWTQRSLPSNNTWWAITYGNGLFIIITGYDPTNIILTSPDGINWTQRTLPTTATWRGLCYGNGLYVIVGNGNIVLTSPDGINWTQRTLPTNEWATVTYGNSVYVALGAGNYCATSPDGINWTQRTLPVGFSSRSCITFGNNLFVTVNYATGSTSSLTSPDGINWTQRTLPVGAQWIWITFGNNLFVSIAQNSNIAATVQNFNTTYQFTITSPALPVPDAVYLGGQTLGYSVQETTTPSWQTTTLTYEDSAGTITATASEYTVAGTHVVLRVQNLNNGDVVSMVGADLQITEPSPTPAPDYTTTGGINVDYLIKVNGTVIGR